MPIKLTKADMARSLPALLKIQEQRKHNHIEDFYPDTGPLRREMYPKHLEHFKAGKLFRELALMAANRSGKTTAAGYETALHLTGIYPAWWEGHRWDRAIQAWACGDTAKNTREIVQRVLLGPREAIGTGMIRKDCIVKTSPKTGIPDAIESVIVRHISGQNSHLLFKSYEQGWEAYTGTEQDLIWLDEEPDMRIYTECQVRTMTVMGHILLTFTPLYGRTELVQSYLRTLTEEAA